MNMTKVMTNIHAKQGLQTVGDFGVRRPRAGRRSLKVPNRRRRRPRRRRPHRL